MLKTQITGAKYLSPQTNQMTNLNIAIPADSKDTEFGTSDILLAKDVVAYLNALDSDISNELATQTDKINKINESIKQLIDHNLIKIVTELPTTDIDKNCIYLVLNKDGQGNNVFVEYIYVESKNAFEEVGRIQAKVDLTDYYTKEETDSLIEMAKNSAINMHNENNTKSIKLDINDTEAVGNYGSPVNVSLTDNDNNCIIDISASEGFIHTVDKLSISKFNGLGVYVGNESYYSGINAYEMFTSDINDTKIIDINTNKELTELEQDDGYSPVDISLTDGNNNVRINATNGSICKNEDGFKSELSGYGLLTSFNGGMKSYLSENSLRFSKSDSGEELIHIGKDYGEDYYMGIGSDGKFKILRPGDNTEGATITGVKSIKAFSDPSNTKVFATDGSIADLATKANKSDIVLKKDAEGGYYIERNGSGMLGYKAFCVNDLNTASGQFSFAEGNSTSAYGIGSHAEGSLTSAENIGAHAEGYMTRANASCSHAEGKGTIADCDGSHAQGIYNVQNVNAIHSIGIGDNLSTRKNSEFVYYNKNADQKNGYKYLIGVGGYDGISTDNSTYKSVQEVIADLTARIEQLETKVRALEAANTPA